MNIACRRTDPSRANIKMSTIRVTQFAIIFSTAAWLSKSTMQPQSAVDNEVRFRGKQISSILRRFLFYDPSRNNDICDYWLLLTTNCFARLYLQ